MTPSDNSEPLFHHFRLYQIGLSTSFSPCYWRDSLPNKFVFTKRNTLLSHLPGIVKNLSLGRKHGRLSKTYRFVCPRFASG